MKEAEARRKGILLVEPELGSRSSAFSLEPGASHSRGVVLHYTKAGVPLRLLPGFPGYHIAPRGHMNFSIWPPYLLHPYYYIWGMIFIYLRMNFYIFKNLDCPGSFGGKNFCTFEGVIIVWVFKEPPSEKNSQFLIMLEDCRTAFELEVRKKSKYLIKTNFP